MNDVGKIDPRELRERLLKIAETVAHDRRLDIGDAALRTLSDQVAQARFCVSDDDSQLDYQAVCLVECLRAIVHARTDRDEAKEGRALCYLNSFVGFMRSDANPARRAS